MISHKLLSFRYFLIIQLLILSLSAYLDFLPFYFLLGLAVIILLSLTIYANPIFTILILMTGVIIDALIPYKFQSSSPSIMVGEVLFVISVPIVFLRFIFDLDLDFKIDNKILIWIPFLIWALLIGLVVGIDKLKIISFWKNYFLGFLVFAIALLYIKTPKQVEYLIKSLIVWGVILAILEIKVIIESGSFFAGLVGLYLHKNLLSVGWGKSNYLAAFFVALIPLTIGYLIYNKKLSAKFLVVVSLVLMFFAITLTLSRGGILALLLALLFLIPKVLKKKYLIPFSLVSLIVLFIIIINPLTYVLIERISTLETSSSVYSRIHFYVDVWKAFLDHPLTGVGLGNLGYHSKFILGPDLSPSAHNIVLGSLGELGIIGAFFYLSIFFYLGIQIFKQYRAETNESLKTLKWSFFISFIAAMLHTLVEPTLEGFQFSIIFWTIVGLNFKLNLLKVSNDN